ncbi:MAG: NAD-dependent epimerase/dehydratase family protein, partial [Armatimonadota bacterium]
MAWNGYRLGASSALVLMLLGVSLLIVVVSGESSKGLGKSSVALYRRKPLHCKRSAKAYIFRRNDVKVLVTGGSGKAGRYVVREMAEAGHEVTNVDRARPSGDSGGGRFLQANLTDAGEVYD